MWPHVGSLMRATDDLVVLGARRTRCGLVKCRRRPPSHLNHDPHLHWLQRCGAVRLSSRRPPQRLNNRQGMGCAPLSPYTTFAACGLSSTSSCWRAVVLACAGRRRRRVRQTYVASCCYVHQQVWRRSGALLRASAALVTCVHALLRVARAGCKSDQSHSKTHSKTSKRARKPRETSQKLRDQKAWLGARYEEL